MDDSRNDGKRRSVTAYAKPQIEAKTKAGGGRDAGEAGLLADENDLLPAWADIRYDHHRDNIAPSAQESSRPILCIRNVGAVRRRIAEVTPRNVERFTK